MVELIESIQHAGGKIVKASYSDVWHDDRTRAILSDSPELRSSLMVVATGQDSTIVAEDYLPPERSLHGDIQKQSDVVLSDMDVDSLKNEVASLRKLVSAYESGRFMRMMKWLHGMGIVGN